MGKAGLNDLEKYAQAAGDQAWAAFLGAAPVQEPSFDNALGEGDLRGLHELAKAAFVDELAASCGPNGNALTWALSMVGEDDLDVGIAKQALALSEEPQSVHDFVFKFAGADPGVEDLHELAKVAFVQELRDILAGDDDLVKEAVALVDDHTLDRAIAADFLGLEKVAVFQGLGRMGLNLGKRMAGGVAAGAQAVGQGAAKGYRATQRGLGSAMRSTGAGLERWGAGSRIKSGLKGEEWTTKGEKILRDKPGSMRGRFLKGRGDLVTGDFLAGAGPGGKRMRFGEWLQGKGRGMTARGEGTFVPPVKTPKPAAAADDVAPAAVKGEEVSAKELKDLVAASGDDAAAAAAGKGEVAAGKGEVAAGKGEVAGSRELSDKVVPDGKPPADGEYQGLVEGFSGWFDRATPLQKTLAIGVPALGAEAALD